MLDGREMMGRIKEGKRLLPSEIGEIRFLLTQGCEDAQAHNLVRALALSVNSNPSDISLISNYLDKNDEYAQVGAVYALCRYWDLAINYIGRLIVFSNFKTWSEKPYLSQVSISEIGDLFFQHKEVGALRILVELSEAAMEKDPLYRKDIFAGLAVALHGTVEAVSMGEHKNPTESALLKRARLVLGRFR